MTAHAGRPHGIGERLTATIESWPESLARDFRAYLAESAAGTEGSGPRSPPAAPYWSLLPGWLLERHKAAAGVDSAADGFLADVAWGQYCLFLAVRLRDDLFDQQTHLSSLADAADRLLTQSNGAFTPHFPSDSPFWAVLTESLETTSQAILEVDRLQQEPGGLAEATVHLYPRVCEILKIGSVAVCHRLDLMEILEAVGRYCDHLAVVGHLCDDFLDMEEDLRRGRYNFAANLLLGTGTTTAASLSNARGEIARQLLFSGRFGVLFDRIRRELDDASTAASRLGLSAASGHVESLRESVGQLEAALHEARVRRVFAGIAAPMRAERASIQRRPTTVPLRR